MALQYADIREKIAKRRKGAIISKAVKHQNRLRFHAQTSMSCNVGQPLTDFLSWVKNILPDDKYHIFTTLFRYPISTNKITSICFDKLSRVFDGRNPAYNYQFLNTEERDDWEYYRQEALKEPTIWQTEGWEHFRTDINSVLIVDLPTEPIKGEARPTPYFYWLGIDKVIDYQIDRETGNMEYIIFRQPDKKIAVFDNEYYRVYAEDKAQNIGALLVENRHELGYCPARFFWNVPMSLDEPDIKESPLTNQLEALDWYLFYHISKRHLDLYGAYPIYSGYEQACDYSNQENGDYCDGGFLKDKSGYYRLDQTGLLCRCPKCGDKRIAGVGSFVEIPIPHEPDQPDLRNPVQMLNADVNSLKYNVDELVRLKEDIITATVGEDAEIMRTQAVNEKQVNANFENQSTILNRVKKGFEEAQTFVDSTICRLRYGNAFVTAKINLGTEFYTLSAETLRARYKTAKEAGASEAELDAMQTQILETEYRTNPIQLQRMLILAELEPYRHLSRTEVLELHGKGVISDEDLRIKVNFSDLVRRFERENTNIIEFGSARAFSDKINIIKNKFKEYVNQE